MQCTHCKAQLPEQATFCPSCGTRQVRDSVADSLAADVEESPKPGEPPFAADQSPGILDDEGATELWTPLPEEATESSAGLRPAGGTDSWSLPADDATGSAAQAGAARVSLQAGRRLGDRYEVLQLLGEGGMGSVYKARDIELDRLVALKVIRPELARDPEVLQRFKQEIILARQVTHRNVIRIFDLGQAEGLKFISMEYVEGRDLYSLLKQKGKFSVEEAVGIMEQVCLALEEAHQEGVVHRDLKPHNIMLDAQGRVVVMDFGIARSVQITGMTQTGSLLGTPDYMSPEQVKGQPADARSDLFALGVIFFQLVTGKVPFTADSPMAAMYKRTQERARSAREINPEVPGLISDAISRCLELQPQRRHQSARELLQDLELWRGGTPGGIGQTVRTLRWLRPRRIFVGRRVAVVGALAAAIVLVFVAALLLRPEPGPGTDQVTPGGEVISLAILPFRNVSGEQQIQWLSSGLAEMLRTDVGESDDLHTVSADRLHQVLNDLRVSADTGLDATMRRRIAEFTSAERLLWGQFIKLGDQIRIDANVEDVANQRIEQLKVEAASESELLAAIERLAVLVRQNLALSREGIDRLAAEAFRPSSDSITALRFYTQGLELLRQGNNLEAVKHFENSVAEDTGFALAYSKLAEAYHLNGFGREATENSRRALQLSEGLPPQERYLIVAADARITNDLDKGVEAYQNLLARRPQDPDLHYELGTLYESEGLFDKAQEHYSQTLAADPQNLSALLASGRALMMKGDAQGSLTPLNRALTLAVQLDNQEAESNTLQSLGQAYRSLNRLEDALRQFELSLEIKRRLGDQRGTAASLNGLAYVQDLSGDFDAARGSYEEAIRIYRQIGDQRGEGIGLMNLGDMERLRGNYDESLRLTREALQIQIDTNDEFNQGLSLNNIGATYYLQGKYDDAVVYYQRALEIRERLEVPGEIADTLHNLGETYTTMGRFDRALDHHLRALDLRREMGDERGTALESYFTGKIFAAKGRYRAALEAVSEASATYRRLGDRSAWFAEALAWHGNALSLLGRTDEAQGLLAEALSLAAELQDEWLRAQTLVLEGDRLFLAGELAEAARVYGAASKAAASTGDPLIVVTTELGAARVALYQGSVRQAAEGLETALAAAKGLGVKTLVCEASIDLGAALIASGKAGRARDLLGEAVRDSTAMGALPLAALAHYHLAAAQRALGQQASAEESASAAAQALAEMQREAGSDTLLLRTDLKAIGEAG